MSTVAAPSVPLRHLRGDLAPTPTVREMQVLQLLFDDCLTRKEIAFRLQRSGNMVNIHIYHAMQRLGAESVLDLAKWYWTVGKVSI